MRHYLRVPSKEGGRIVDLGVGHSAVDVLHQGIKLILLQAGNNGGDISGLGGGQGIQNGLGVLVLSERKKKGKKEGKGEGRGGKRGRRRW